MRIRGAVLREVGQPSPYAASAPLRVVELDLAPPGPGEVLVQLEAAGLCHSDLSVVDGSRVRPVPMLLGHEGAGRVLEVGSGVRDVAVGDRVVLTFLPRCGECAGCATDGVRPCVPGSASNGAGELLGGGRRLSSSGQPVHHHLGVSAFATHAVVDERSLVVLPDDVPSDVAALLGCAVLTGGGAVRNASRVRAGERIAVVGLGGVGMAALLVALGLDDVEVAAVDPVEAKRDAALALGAAGACEPEAAEVGAFDVVIEAAGSARAFETAYRMLGPGGRLVTVGLPAPGAMATIAPLDLVAGGRSIIGSYLGSAVPRRDIPVFVEMWRAGRLPVERLVSHHIGLDDLNAGLDRLASGAAIRQVITF